MRPILSASATVLKMLLGMLFLFSASAKLVSVENFEIYIYTFRFFSLGASFVLARAVIVGELLLGAWLLSNKFHRQACLTNFGVLILFSLFLVYVMLLGRTDDCHCFGEVAGFTPAQSLLKNAVLILLLLFVWRYADGGWRPRWWLAAPLALLPEALLVALGFAGVVHLIYADLYALIAVAVCMAVVGALSSLLLSDVYGLLYYGSRRLDSPSTSVFVQRGDLPRATCTRRRAVVGRRSLRDIFLQRLLYPLPVGST